ncbi:MAG TPA: ATP-binding protein [Blastocatellia bacterium]
MRLLKLHTRTMILTSAVLTTVLLLAVYFFVTKIREIELQDHEQRAMLWATQFANLLTDDDSRKTTDLIARATEFSEEHGGQIRQIRIYGETPRGLVEITPGEREQIAAGDLQQLLRGQPVSSVRRMEIENEQEMVIYAAAPIIEENDFRGAVSLTTSPVRFSDLLKRSTSLVIALLAFAIISITALLYIFFSQVIYRPVEDLLGMMSEVKAGNLDAVAPVRARDEFGQLAVSFNHMLSRLREMTAEREAYQQSLEERVREATAALADRNFQLEEANATLFEIQRELTKYERLAAAGQLAAQFAHEVGTPLNLISGHVQLLAARTDDQKTRDRLDLVSSQISRIERIVRNMLDATRRPRPQLEPVDLNALLRRIFEVTAPTLAAHQVELVTDFDDFLPPVLGDGEQLQQVFINLVNNGLDAMPDGGQLTFSTAVVNGQISVGCRDTGEGIKEEIRQRIFDPLFTTKLSGRGSGLGLAVVQQILREHGGSIAVGSSDGPGAEFQIQLPIAEMRKEVAAAHGTVTS